VMDDKGSRTLTSSTLTVDACTQNAHARAYLRRSQ
jgi:hypothetical protein